MRLINLVIRHARSAANLLARFNPISLAFARFLVARRGRLVDIEWFKSHRFLKDAGVCAVSTHSKDVITRQACSYKPRAYELKGFSSGTTNTPVTVYRTLINTLVEEYFMLKYWMKHGYRFYDPVLVLRGEDVSRCTTGRHIHLPFENKTVFSSYDLSPLHIKELIQLLEGRKIQFIQAYPSAVYQLAALFKSVGYRPTYLRAIFTSSESWAAFDLSLVETQLAPVFDQYGQAERVACFQTCSSRKYHLLEDYSFVELDDVGSGVYEILGTTLHNSAMPLWRYRTGDYVKGLFCTSCSCGDPAPYVDEIVGRSDDYIISSDGARIGRLNVAFNGIANLVSAQVVQNKLDAIIVNCVAVIKSEVEGQKLREDVRAALRSRIGSIFEISVYIVDQIPRGANGKFKSVISTLDLR